MNYANLVSYCNTIPDAHSGIKWSSTLVFMVANKMFALFTLDSSGRPTDLWCRVDDDLFLSYTGQDGIRPAPYLARAKWIALERRAMSDAAAKKLLRRARDIVAKKLPKRVQRELHEQPE
jgi:predicted DNA-binding protein (MmcQ/YjbR family)